MMCAQSWEVGAVVAGVDYYELLGVERNASTAEIKSAYRTLARSMHPDVGGTAGTFQMLREAYETLNDPVRRATYDGTCAARENPPVPRTPEPRSDTHENLRDFGDDPHHVPRRVRLMPDEITWWDSVNPHARVRFTPRAWPSASSTLGLLAGWTTLLLVGTTLTFSALLLAVWLSLVISAGAVLVVLLRRCLEARREDRGAERELREQTVFGRPEPEQPAQQLTAELMVQYLTRMPGVRIFHGLSLPGSVFVDVDHAVLCGDRVVLIESKRWLPGHYTGSEDGRLWRNGHRFRGGGTRLPESIAAFEELLPEVDVRGALVIYPSRAGEVTTAEAGDATIAPLTPERFVQEIGQWLASDPATVNRDLVAAVLEQVLDG